MGFLVSGLPYPNYLRNSVAFCLAALALESVPHRRFTYKEQADLWLSREDSAQEEATPAADTLSPNWCTGTVYCVADCSALTGQL